MPTVASGRKAMPKKKHNGASVWKRSNDLSARNAMAKRQATIDDDFLTTTSQNYLPTSIPDLLSFLDRADKTGYGHL